MKVIFLDIDGVLNDHTFNLVSGSCTLKPECVHAFNRLLHETDAAVVISSAWRYLILIGAMSTTGFCHLLQTHGVSKIILERIAGKTVSDETIPTRGEQIAHWIRQTAKRQPVDRFVILDDAPPEMSFRPVENSLIRIDGSVGLTEDDVPRALDLLNRPCHD